MTSTEPITESVTTAAEPVANIDSLLENSLRDIGIPPRPLILDRIAAEMQQDDPDFKRLATIISADVSLAAGLIKTANSPFFGSSHRARNVGEALTVLGLKVAGRAIAGIILHKVFPNAPQLVRFWDASASVARVSGWLAKSLPDAAISADDAYTFGLFRDCGIPVLMRRFPDYEKTLSAANGEPERSFTAVEDAKFPANHAQVGCLLAQSWWLPDTTCRAIRQHHDSSLLAPPAAGSAPNPEQQSVQMQIAVAQLAEYLIQQHSGLCRTHEWSKLGTNCLNILNIVENDLASLLTEAAAVINSDD